MNQTTSINIWILLSVIALGMITGLGAFTFFYAEGYSYSLDDPTAPA